MTEGSPSGLLIRFAIPMMIGNIFQQLYNLVEAAKNGDSNAFTQLYNSSYKMVYLTCLGHLKNKEDAEDTTQDIPLSLHDSLQEYKPTYQRACCERLRTVRSA